MICDERKGACWLLTPPELRRAQAIEVPTAACGELNPSWRTAVSFSTTAGCASTSDADCSTASVSRLSLKNLPARGARPCSSRKPIPTGAPCNVNTDPSEDLTSIGNWRRPIAGDDVQAVDAIPGS